MYTDAAVDVMVSQAGSYRRQLRRAVGRRRRGTRPPCRPTNLI